MNPILFAPALLFVFLFSVGSLPAEPVETIPLWKGEVPGEADQEVGEEKSVDKNNDGILRIHNVSRPMLTFYPAPVEKQTGASVIVCPGGGYGILAAKHEGTDVCEWLNRIGVNAFLLKYRVPRRKGLEKHHAPLQDLQRAVGVVRARSAEWKLDPDRVGALGFSAGGHLVTMALTSDGSRSYKADPELDGASCIPNFAILIYPAYLKHEKEEYKLSDEINITDTTPPAFVVVGHGDKRWVEGAALFYLAMNRVKRDCELHIYSKGGHGFGMKNIPERVSEWPDRAGEWMQEMGWLNASEKPGKIKETD